jgi:hypothetical protein
LVRPSSLSSGQFCLRLDGQEKRIFLFESIGGEARRGVAPCSSGIRQYATSQAYTIHLQFVHRAIFATLMICFLSSLYGEFRRSVTIGCHRLSDRDCLFYGEIQDKSKNPRLFGTSAGQIKLRLAAISLRPRIFGSPCTTRWTLKKVSRGANYLGCSTCWSGTPQDLKIVRDNSIPSFIQSAED